MVLLGQVRLMLVLAPAACCLAGVAVHEALAALFRGLHARDEQDGPPPKEDPKPKKGSKASKVVPPTFVLTFLASASTYVQPTCTQDNKCPPTFWSRALQGLFSLSGM
jgi:asparagine N-glycosylation enzyme membrane subunit Stt3